MDPIFLFGTLLHEPLRQIVLGGAATIRPAHLDGYGVFRVADTGFPLIRQSARTVAEGLLLSDPDAEMLARMDYYESAFGYRREPLEVMTAGGPVAAQVYLFDGQGGDEAEEPWSCAVWAGESGELTCLVAEEIMADWQVRPASAVARRLAPLRARAQARLNAQDTAPTTLRRHAAPEDVQLARRALAYADFFSVEEYHYRFRRFSGDFNAEVKRAAFVSADAITLLPYDPIRDRVLLVEQLRTGPLGRGDPQPWLLEAIAGRIDGGETPEEAVLREAREEAGIAVTDLMPVGRYYASPGAKTEFIFGFLALADLPEETSSLGGLASEDEDIRSHVISFDHAMALIDSGEINVGPLIILLLHLARLRPGLMTEAAGAG